MIYAILGLSLGVFYREFTKFNDYFEPTMMSQGHTHALALGSFFFLTVLVMEKLFNIIESKRYKGWFITYNIALVGVIATMVIRGIMQVKGIESSMFSEIAGTFHTLYAVALVWFIIMLKKAVLPKKEK